MPFDFVGSGLGCDTAAVVHILAHRDVTQRGLIQQEYRAMYSEDLVKRLSSELSGDVKVITEESIMVLPIFRCNMYLCFIDDPTSLFCNLDTDAILFPLILVFVPFLF